MTDKKAVPPIVEVFVNGPGIATLLLGGQHLASGNTSWVELMAASLNAAHEKAVASREANLVAALRSALNHINHSYHCGATGGGALLCGCGATEAGRAARAALDGTGPDVVAELRAQLEAERAEGRWMLLHDLAQTGGLAGERAAEVMRALGMKAE